MENQRKNNKGMYTYGNESDCTFFKTKKEAKEHRKENFGSLYASEAEMDRLIPIRKVEQAIESAKAESAQMIEDITNEISEAMTLAIGSDKKVNILGGEFNVSWFESMGFYTFMVECEDWSIETSVKIEVWNELQEEAQEDIANGLARILYVKMLLTFSQVSFNKRRAKLWKRN